MCDDPWFLSTHVHPLATHSVDGGGHVYHAQAQAGSRGAQAIAGDARGAEERSG